MRMVLENVSKYPNDYLYIPELKATQMGDLDILLSNFKGKVYPGFCHDIYYINPNDLEVHKIAKNISISLEYKLRCLLIYHLESRTVMRFYYTYLWFKFPELLQL